MSQVHIIDITGGFPQIPTEFIGNLGTSVPIANQLEILGTTVAAGTNPLITFMSGNTVEIRAQISQAIAATDATKIGLAAFNSSDFTVDANGFVSAIAAGGTVMSVSGTANRITSTGGTDPIIDIAATYIGQMSITTLGTITTGLWNGTTVGTLFGGTGLTAYVTGDILYASAVNTLSRLPVGLNTQVLTLSGGVPTWATPTTGTVTSVSGTANRITSTGGATPVIDIAATYVGQTSLTTLGTITTGVWNGTVITVPYGGTGAATLTDRGVLVGRGTSPVEATAVGSAGQVLQSSGAGVNPAYSTATYPSTTTVSQLLYSSSANVVAGLATANRAVLTTNSTGVPVVTALATDGQLIIGSTAGAPAAATLTAGTGISITNASNSITINTTGSGMAWVEITGTSQSAAINTGYVANNAGLVTITLPANFSLGDVITIVGLGAGLWSLVANTGDIINFGSNPTSAGGSITATNRYDTIEVVGVVTNTTWVVRTSIGNLTVA